jgi:hypothetical protein
LSDRGVRFRFAVASQMVLSVSLLKRQNDRYFVFFRFNTVVTLAIRLDTLFSKVYTKLSVFMNLKILIKQTQNIKSRRKIEHRKRLILEVICSSCLPAIVKASIGYGYCLPSAGSVSLFAIDMV